MISRRGFLAAAAAALLIDPGPVSGQSVPRIGLLGDASWEPLKQGLRDIGYVPGKTLVVEERRSGGRSERWPELARELLRLNVRVIVTVGTPATLAARQATGTVPIVMAATGDPLSTGLVASLARPGGNVTGLMQLGAGLAAKRLELLKEVIPNVARVAFLWNPANPDQKSHFHEAQAGARSLGLALHSVEVRAAAELEPAFAAMMAERPAAMLMTGDTVHQLQIDWIIGFAARQRLPVMYQLKENVERGGLMSYGPIRADLIRRSALYVDKILKGANPAELPVEQPTKFELVINLKTAQALGLTIPPAVLIRADHVIR